MSDEEKDLGTPKVRTWDPKPSERIYYRSHNTGDLGYLVRRDGKDQVRLDRPEQEIVIPFRTGEWDPEQKLPGLNRMQKAQIAWEADCKLRYFLGDHQGARKTWLSLREKERIDYAEDGPEEPASKLLWRAIMSSLGEDNA